MKSKHLKIAMLLALGHFSMDSEADVKVYTTLCNTSQNPVEFSLYNHNDIFAGAVPLVKKAVRACSSVVS